MCCVRVRFACGHCRLEFQLHLVSQKGNTLKNAAHARHTRTSRARDHVVLGTFGPSPSGFGQDGAGPNNELVPPLPRGNHPGPGRPDRGPRRTPSERRIARGRWRRPPLHAPIRPPVADRERRLGASDMADVEARVQLDRAIQTEELDRLAARPSRKDTLCPGRP